MQVACALYEAAVAKFEAVLELDPGNKAVLRNCAFALYDLARLQPDFGSRAARQLLEVWSCSLLAACDMAASEFSACPFIIALPCGIHVTALYYSTKFRQDISGLCFFTPCFIRAIDWNPNRMQKLQHAP
jgi:hypothetical protein